MYHHFLNIPILNWNMLHLIRREKQKINCFIFSLFMLEFEWNLSMNEYGEFFGRTFNSFYDLEYSDHCLHFHCYIHVSADVFFSLF